MTREKVRPISRVTSTSLEGSGKDLILFIGPLEPTDLEVARTVMSLEGHVLLVFQRVDDQHEYGSLPGLEHHGDTGTPLEVFLYREGVGPAEGEERVYYAPRGGLRPVLKGRLYKGLVHVDHWTYTHFIAYGYLGSSMFYSFELRSSVRPTSSKLAPHWSQSVLKLSSLSTPRS